jgi:hypothetical protein
MPALVRRISWFDTVLVLPWIGMGIVGWLWTQKERLPAPAIAIAVRRPAAPAVPVAPIVPSAPVTRPALAESLALRSPPSGATIVNDGKASEDVFAWEHVLGSVPGGVAYVVQLSLSPDFSTHVSEARSILPALSTAKLRPFVGRNYWRVSVVDRAGQLLRRSPTSSFGCQQKAPPPPPASKVQVETEAKREFRPSAPKRSKVQVK